MESGSQKLSGVYGDLRQQLELLLEGVQIIDENWEYIFVNDVFARQVEIPRERLTGANLKHIFPGVEQLDVYDRMRDCLINGVVQRFETYFVFPDGHGKWFDARIVPIPEGICVFTLDITEFKETLAYNNRIRNLYSLLRQINQSIVYLKTERKLFSKACFIGVTEGKFNRCWIGIVKPSNETGIQLAAAQSVAGEPDTIPRSLRTAGSEIQRTVLETGNAFILDSSNRELHTESAKELEKIGMYSAISLPIRKNGKVCATFNLYSATPDFMGTEEIDLLLEVSGDLSYAVGNLEKAKKHRQTELLVIQNEKRFRAMIEKGKDMKTMATEPGRLLYGSPSITNVLGYEPEDLEGISVFEIVHPDDKQRYTSMRKSITEAPNKSADFEVRFRHKNGPYVWCEGTSTNMLQEPGVNAIVCNFRDVSDKKMAQRQLEFDRQNMKALISNTNDIEWSVDTDLNLIIANGRFDEYTDKAYGFRILPGEPVLHRGLKPQGFARYNEYYRRALAGEIFTDIVETSIPGRWSEISFYPIQHGDEVVGAACNARDISASLNLQRSLNQSVRELSDYKYAIDVSSIVSITDQNGTITFVNENFCIASGYMREELIGQNHSMLNSGYHPQTFIASLYNTIQSGNPWRGEFRNRRKDGSFFWIDMTVIPFLDEEGKPYQFIALQSDITTRKNVEQQLQKNVEHLRRANAELDRFVYSISHDLRAPLTSIRGLLAIVEEETLESHTLEHMKLIAGRIDRLDMFIKNVLNYSRINKEAIQKKLVDPEEVAREIVDSLSGIKVVDDLDFILDFHQEADFCTDRQALSTILENLISNAIKFQHPQRHYRYIRVSGIATSAALELVVEDNGIGIPGVHHDQVFDMFYRLPGNTEGTGIGLYLVKQTVDKLNGTIILESAENEGTLFRIKLKNLCHEPSTET